MKRRRFDVSGDVVLNNVIGLNESSGTVVIGGMAAVLGAGRGGGGRRYRSPGGLFGWRVKGVNIRHPGGEAALGAHERHSLKEITATTHTGTRGAETVLSAHRPPPQITI